MPSRYGLTIRAANGGDADGVAVLLRASGLAAAPRALSLQLDEIPTQSGLVLLAEEWGPPSGVLALSWRWTLLNELKVADISLLLVDPEQRRRGVARLLLKAAARAARAAGCGRLRIVAPNVAQDLASFCLDTGFERIGDTFVRPLHKQRSNGEEG